MKISLLVLFSSSLLIACGVETTSESAGSEVSAAQMFNSQQCVHCHGPQGHGVAGTGPDLRSIDEFWTVDELVEYLADPKTYSQKDERLAANLGKYRMPMPLSNLSEERRKSLAEFVLALE